MKPLFYASVSKQYNAFELKPFDLKLNEGDVVGLIGANGAGKTTLLNILEGRCCPSSAEVSYRNQAMNPISWKKNPVVALYDGICPFCEKFKPKDICKIGSDWYPKWNSKQFYEYLEILGVQPIRIHQMSLGTKNKLMLAVMLAQNAEILFCDELTTGLDLVAREKVLDLLKEYIGKSHAAMIFSTHIISDLQNFASRIILIDKGEVILNTEVSRILEKEQLPLEEIIYKYIKENMQEVKNNIIEISR